MMAMLKAAIATIAIIIAVIGLTTSVLSALVASHSISNTGSITTVGVGVYSNSACTNAVSSISWGNITPGSAVNDTVYVKNLGSAQETLNMTTTGWNPTATSSYITLTWNQAGTVLAAGSHVAAVLTLTVSSSISGITSFSFNTTITGTQ
jgi:hypothetical protein